ncbi:hypothetical protein A2U01_0068329, partial [Trifolium medium]|nr:hypothetical protein [Trifolium medium]
RCSGGTWWRFTGDKDCAYGCVEADFQMRFWGRTGSGNPIQVVGLVAGKVVGMGGGGGSGRR